MIKEILLITIEKMVSRQVFIKIEDGEILGNVHHGYIDVKHS